MPRHEEGHRLLISLAAVSLDTETTGLSVHSDRIVAVAAVPLVGTSIEAGACFERLVRPDIPIPESSTAIHGITDAAVSAAPLIAEVLPLLNDFCAEAVIVGHNTAFDIAVLRAESARCGAAWWNRPWLDVGLLTLALNPALGDAGLESSAGWLGVPVVGRHSALGDALLAAEIFVRLIPRLRDAGVRTLAEAQRFQETPTGALAMQRAAGWFSTPALPEPSRLTRAPATASLARIDSFPYRHRIANFVSTAPSFVPGDTAVVEAAALLHRGRGDPVLVVEPGPARRTGIFTERDLVAAVAERGETALRCKVIDYATLPLVSVDQGAFVYEALGRMQRLGINYLGVTDDQGHVVGVLSARRLFESRSTHAILIGDRIAAAGNARELAAAAEALPRLAHALFDEGVRAIEICAVISDVIRHLTARAAALAELVLVAAGAGPAPTPWCVLVLGSAGRGESMLVPDQDNALVYLGSHEHGPWFGRLAETMVAILDEAGIPYCKGEVMANNEVWRRNLAGWRDEIGRWARMESEASVAGINAFYDLEAVFGEPRIAAELRDIATRCILAQEVTLATVARAVARVAPPIGVFGRFKLTGSRLDLKGGALLPLVTAARVLGLHVGSSARATPDRFREAHVAGLLNGVELESLIAVHELLLDVLLKQQLRDLAHGRPASYAIDVAELDTPTAERLRRALRHLGEFLRRLPELRPRP
ncbi:MAG: CBS domain-containing protein [Gammaproteobacteria bacterium]|nr:CBS domain-containing protein [Gammaproteobacteria bacterium]MBI5618238.1 CBS domain-containing protein [Gammaproteobacteria bacterium]